MHFRTVLSGTLALLLLSSIAAPAAGTGQPADSGFSFHLPTLGIFGEKKKPEQQQVAQQDGASATGLEDQLRQMNGKIEELNFQILQMQEQIRKQQEDNEFRFQQLEGGTQGGQQPASQKKSDATPAPNSDGNTESGTDNSVAEAPAKQAPADAGNQSDGGQSVGEVIVESQTGDPGKVITGAPPKTFGTITVDKNGNVVNADGNTQASAPAETAPAAPAPATDAKAGKSGGTVVAALPSTNDPDELYRNSYQFILSGDYGTAEQGFRDHISRFPKDTKAADAHYWLGESLLGQQKYRDAAEVFLAASKDYPKAKKAPDMLLKLGVSLVGLKQNDVACATFGEIGKRYPDISSALKERVKQERALAAC
ncbi:tol-pal system protein YbgF [Mesorhizobium sp. M4B.F.Ca.ET.215.01.1.1]|uniref:tol-pal system protein YbgF n=1 Tax=unclassified Mesorhizobium TaxID=325217 RepID=UPI000FCA284B|nr:MULTISPECIES: tol-pal system protein YbgF [unclassified Mesorhizobium]RUW23322.1 tol-pal system protein YbgF [Mesorhizobium sp. M4B.F.Ca.ET.013.02.1.1]RVD37837.1 tol-pal system protein YbgF [Mesorhizobium sp. M4B.F.Ca.ET.019.03.1.1]RWF64414.1 MAG: tol-pal system protein YbgF [Mesorhizobium sp.]TGQ07075.1 tol-pal system protein YbgF [Mesorhizobium sp. M4B.F.Ca.ET.215.01.1.1]TGQ27930.1 tol-pal system protein YbgF [Mesorhizobium sp. M4B.F.Ca.ET.214.01.1.1]